MTMATPQKIVAALHANWVLNAAGLVLSFCATVVLVRTVPQALYAEYAAILAIIGIATFVFDAGGNSGLTRYLHDASKENARGTFYTRMQRRRLLAAGLCAATLVFLGPIYARSSHFESLAARPWLFALIAVIVAASLARLLAHYGLIALFETKTALLFQQGFQIARAVGLATVALAGGSLPHLVAVLVAITAIEALIVHTRLWRIIGGERTPIEGEFVNRAQKFGLLTIVDKGCAMLGSGSVLLLVLAPQQSVATVALLGVAVELVGKLVSLTVMPMGNLVAPYLSQTSDDPAAQGLAAARVTKFSSLLYGFGIGAGALALPWFVPAIYGESYAGAAGFALLLLVPAAFENWVRGCCSPVLMRNGRYAALMRINAIQAVVTLAVLAFVHRQPVEVVLLAVGSARAAVAALNLFAMRRIVPAGTFRVPCASAAIGVLACSVAVVLGQGLPLPGAAQLAVQALLFAAVFYVGLRWLILRDADTLRIAHRLTRKRACGWLLPPLPC